MKFLLIGHINILNHRDILKHRSCKTYFSHVALTVKHSISDRKVRHRMPIKSSEGIGEGKELALPSNASSFLQNSIWGRTWQLKRGSNFLFQVKYIPFGIIYKYFLKNKMKIHQNFTSNRTTNSTMNGKRYLVSSVLTSNFGSIHA